MRFAMRLLVRPIVALLRPALNPAATPRLVAPVAVLALVLAGCGDDAATPSGEGAPASAEVEATLEDFDIELSEPEVAAGEVGFEVTNEGDVPHNFAVLRTTLPEDDLPTNDDGSPDLDAEGVEVVERLEDIEAGTSASTQAELGSGEYVVVCDRPGHYEKGMHATLDVR